MNKPNPAYAKWKKEIKKIETRMAETKLYLDVLTLYGEFASETEWEILNRGNHEVRMFNNLLEHLRDRLARRAK